MPRKTTLTRAQLSRYARLGRELRLIEEQLANMPMVTDVVQASSRHHPYLPHTVTITGIDVKRVLRLRRRRAYLRAQRREIEQFVESIKDAYLRELIRARYVEGLTWVQLGQRLGTTSESIRKAANRYLASMEGSKKLSAQSGRDML